MLNVRMQIMKECKEHTILKQDEIVQTQKYPMTYTTFFRFLRYITARHCNFAKNLKK